MAMHRQMYQRSGLLIIVFLGLFRCDLTLTINRKLSNTTELISNHNTRTKYNTDKDSPIEPLKKGDETPLENSKDSQDVKTVSLLTTGNLANTTADEALIIVDTVTVDKRAQSNDKQTKHKSTNHKKKPILNINQNFQIIINGNQERPYPFPNDLFQRPEELTAEESEDIELNVNDNVTRVAVTDRLLRGFGILPNQTDCTREIKTYEQIVDDVATLEPSQFFVHLMASIITVKSCSRNITIKQTTHWKVVSKTLDPAGVCENDQLGKRTECAENLLRKLIDHWDNSVVHNPNANSLHAFINAKRCINSNNVAMLTKGDRTSVNPFPERAFLYRMVKVLVEQLNEGYSISLDGEPCELTFVEEIFHKYGQQTVHLEDMFITEQKLESLIDDMISVVEAKSRIGPQKNFLLGRESRSVPTSKPTSYNVSELLKIFRMKDRVNVEQFYQMCPSIVDEVLTIRSKTRSGTKSEDVKCNSTTTLTNTEIYGYGTLAVSIISIMSVLGAVVMKAATGAVRQYVMAALLALATGNLCGDALLHLLPEVLSDEGEDADGDGLTTSEIILTGSTDISIASSRMCAVLASIYAFFILELIMSLYHTHDHDHTPGRSRDDLNNGNVSVLKVITDEQYDSNNTASCSTSHDGGERVCKEEQDNIVNRHRAPASLAWMVIVGDAIHNFADGLAIGAAFTGQLSSGLSTSIAVICHELPHELGDFAVLVSTGMSIKKALILNFVSSLTAFAGLYVGIAAGKLEAATEWIFLVGAGMFLYVALANLLPELQKYFQEHRTWQMFVAQNIGILCGYAAMLTIAIFEDDMGF